MSRLRVARGTRSRAFVACEVGDTFYVLPVEQVQEIIEPLPLSLLPHAPEGIIGAIEHRETVVPILDLGQRLGFGPTVAQRRKWVLMRGSERTLGLVVRRVIEVFTAQESSVRSAPDVGNAHLRGAAHVLNYRGMMAFLLNMDIVASLAEMALPRSEASQG
jgi:purine-binding chemotaxis protein CheW